MTYNVGLGKFSSPRIIARVIASVQPDICALQETTPTLTSLILQELSPSLGYSSRSDGTLRESGQRFDVALLSSFPLFNPICIPDMHHAALIATIKDHSREYQIVSCHLHPWNEDERVRELGTLLQFIPSDIPTLLMGDMNALSQNKVYDDIRPLLPPHLTESFTLQGRIRTDAVNSILYAGFSDTVEKHELTIPTPMSRHYHDHLSFRVDYIFTRGVRCKSEPLYTPLTHTASDHYPVVGISD